MTALATQTPTKPMNILTAINTALRDAMTADPEVLVLGEDIGDAEEGGVVGCTKGLSSQFGDMRVRTTPISEQAIIGAAIGASLVGFRPVAEIMLMNFTTVAMDMIVNHAAKLRFMSGGQTHVPIVIRTMTGSGFSTGGQHSDYLEAWFAHTAGINVVAPSCPADAYGLLRSCIENDDPCLFIENMPTYWMEGPAPAPGHHVRIGQANVLAVGTDVTIVTYARMVTECLAAVGKLEESGVSVELIDLRTIAPWDRATVLASAAKTRCVLIVHEAVTPFGVGAEISSVIHEELFSDLRAPVKRLGGAFCPVPFSKPLEAAFAPRAADIEVSVRTLLDQKTVR
jgi:pyruvate dehydrogenase E1 component beta subunit